MADKLEYNCTENIVFGTEDFILYSSLSKFKGSGLKRLSLDIPSLETERSGPRHPRHLYSNLLEL